MLPALLLCLEPAIRQRDPRPVPWPRLFPPIVLLGVVGVFFLLVRSQVVGPGAGDLPHPLWQLATPGQRGLTMLGLVPTVVRLLLWPAHLQADYSPREVGLATGFGASQWLGLVILLGVLVVGWRSARQDPLATSGVLWLGAALLPAANLLIPTGVVLAERTFYLPSAGLALALGALADRVGRLRLEALRLSFGALAWTWLLLAGARSAIRQPVWRDNPTLFKRTIMDAPQSYLAWRSWGGQLVQEARLPEAEAAYRRSLSLFDRDPNILDELAGVLRRQQHCDESVPLLEHALRMDPARNQTASRLVGCLSTLGRYDAARDLIHQRAAGGRPELEGLLSLVDSVEASR